VCFIDDVNKFIKGVEANGRGFVPGELQSFIDSLFEETEPIMDWKTYFRRFASHSQEVFVRKTRRKESKRFAGNPALIIKPKHHILLAIDTSASVSNNDLVEFFQEIQHIHKSGVTLTIIECDSRLHKPYKYDGKVPTSVHGRGGTDFQPVIDYFDNYAHIYSSLIYFTDGECSTPSTPRNPMLWVICSGRDLNPALPGFQIQFNNDNKNKK